MGELPPAPSTPGLVLGFRYVFDQPRLFTEYRRRFGSTWTMRLPGFPPLVVTSDRDAIKALLTGDPLTKRHGNDVLRRILGDRSLLLLEPPEHLARRRLELPAFHGDAIRSFTDRIRERFAAEVDSWPKGRVVRAHERARPLTLGVILEMVLGIRDEALKSRLSKIFESFDTRLNNVGQFAPEGLAHARWNVIGRVVLGRLEKVRGLLSAHVDATRSDPRLAERDDVLAMLVRARDEDGSALTDEDLRDELLTLVLAGHETTATAIGWACDLLAHNPGVQDRLSEAVAAGEREYVKAAAKEVLRARTVAYISAARTPLEPVRVGRWTIGSDAVVMVDAQGLHGDPELYPEPERFRPERFIDSAPPPYAYLPFGGGAHRCLGAALATLELETMLETIATRTRLAPYGPPAEPVRRNLTLAPSRDAPVRVV
jgi:cytochrome P450